MSKAKPPHPAPSDDPVETSNVTPEDADLSQVAALRALADDRARKIAALEKERDQLVRDAGSPDLVTSGGAGTGTLRVVGVDLLTAPEHLLLLRLSGDEAELEELRKRVARSLVKIEAESPETIEVEAGRIGPELRAVIERMPTT